MSLHITQAELRCLYPELAQGVDIDAVHKPQRERKQDAKECFRTAWNLFGKVPFPFVAEYRFHAVRKWRFDWAWVECKLAVEIDGVTSGKTKDENGDYISVGRHQTIDGLTKQYEKTNSGAECGWIILHFTPKMVAANPAGVVEQVKRIAEMRSAAHPVA